MHNLSYGDHPFVNAISIIMNGVLKAITFGAVLYTHLAHVFCLVHHQSRRKVELELSRNNTQACYSRKYGRSLTYEKPEGRPEGHGIGQYTILELSRFHSLRRTHRCCRSKDTIIKTCTKTQLRRRIIHSPVLMGCARSQEDKNKSENDLEMAVDEVDGMGEV